MPRADGFELLNKYRKTLMGFAALWILVFHEWTPLRPYTGPLTIEVFIKQAGFSGVDIFFFLSGFGLYFSARARSLGEFYYRRFSRLLLPFVLVAVGQALTDGWSLSWFLKNLTGLNFFTDDIYDFLWFVPGIATFYLLFPLYHRLFTRAGNKTAFTGCVVILWLLASMFLPGTLRDDLFGFTNRIPIFCLGCLMGYWSERREGGFDRGVWLLLWLLLALGLALNYLTSYKGMQLLVMDANCFLPSVLSTVAIVFLLPKTLELLLQVPALAPAAKALNRFLSFFGMFSLELYCVQEWLGGLLIPALEGRVGALSMNLLVFAVLSAAALALYYAQAAFWRALKRRRTRA